MSKIKIFIIGHKAYPVASLPEFYPIQVGAAISKNHIHDWLRDDTGDNISEKNRSFCELTAHYYCWKNQSADYYGFYHYRRYLSFAEKQSKAPYIIRKSPTKKLLDKLGYNQDIGKFAEKYDIIVPRSEELFERVYDHYKNSPHQRISDLDLVLKILLEKYPDYKDACEGFMSSTRFYFCNMFIMKKDLFTDYCQWLFDILFEFEKRSDKAGYTQQEMRVEGFLAERLFGIYLTKIKAEGKKIREVQRVDFICETGMFFKKRLKYLVITPESRRKKFVKKIYRSIC